MALNNRRIAIIGGGAWGLSTALHLRQAGYTDITVFERAERIPSRYSAACDINKIVRAEYEDKFYSNLALVSYLSDQHALHRVKQQAKLSGRRLLRAGRPL